MADAGRMAPEAERAASKIIVDLPDGQIRIYDNTRVSAFDSCHRKYYYRHERGWTGSGFTAPLGFGAAWHNAMDVIWLSYCQRHPLSETTPGTHQDFPKPESIPHPQEVLEKAWIAFMETWNKEGGPDPGDIVAMQELGARTPQTAEEMLEEYILERAEELRGFELVGAEVPFLVPLDPNDPSLWYAGRKDKIYFMPNRRGLVLTDHKTTSAYSIADTFREYFVDSFDPNAQIEGYAYAAHLLWPDQFLGDIRIDAALVHKKVHDGFGWLPSKISDSRIDQWRWETLDRIRELEANREAVSGLHEESFATQIGVDDMPYMPAFRKDTSACFDFMKPCEYLYQCKAGGNPEAQTEPPIGMEVKFWSPFDVIQLERLGVTREKAGE